MHIVTDPIAGEARAIRIMRRMNNLIRGVSLKERRCAPLLQIGSGISCMHLRLCEGELDEVV